MKRHKLDLLEQKCSKLILDCVDWEKIDGEDTEAAIQNVGNLYDLLYQVYCAKLTLEGFEYDQEQRLREFISLSKEERASGNT